MGTGSALNGKEHPNNLTKSLTTTSKIHPKYLKNHSWTPSFSTLGPFSQLDVQNDTKHTPIRPQMDSKTLQNLVQGPPEWSKGRQITPQEPPTGSQQAPKGCQELPKKAAKWYHTRPRGHPRKKTSEMLINTWENHYSGVKMSINTWENIDPDIQFS